MDRDTGQARASTLAVPAQATHLHDLSSWLLDVELVVTCRVLVVDCLLYVLVGWFILLCLFILLLLLLLLRVVLDVLVPLWTRVVLLLGVVLVGSWSSSSICVFGCGRRGGEAARVAQMTDTADPNQLSGAERYGQASIFHALALYGRRLGYAQSASSDLHCFGGPT